MTAGDVTDHGYGNEDFDCTDAGAGAVASDNSGDGRNVL